jgi:uncharacterized protein
MLRHRRRDEGAQRSVRYYPAGVQERLQKLPQERPSCRPPVDQRRFNSRAVEATIVRVKSMIGDPKLAWLFENCFPNTLDTTVTYREIDGKPETYVITGDIDAMWLRDSTAQVWPYLPLANEDEPLKKLLAGVVRKQTKLILLDPYANAFYDDPTTVSHWASDHAQMLPGVHERKWEIDSLCYAVRLAHGYWKTTDDTSVFDADWVKAMRLVLQTFREEQRLTGLGPYTFKRGGPKPKAGSPELYGTPVKPNGLICSRFRPSDDETEYQFLIPSNFFAAGILVQMAELLLKVCNEPELAGEAHAFSNQLYDALQRNAIVDHPTAGKIFAYELDGMGHVTQMDDANIPSLLSMPYLAACGIDDPIYKNTRAFAWSPQNPWFFKGKHEGIGGPHIGPEMIWPMSQIMRALTSTSDAEIAAALKELAATDADTGFMHESFHINDPTNFTRTWFAWANTLFGEMILKVATERPHLLK